MNSQTITLRARDILGQFCWDKNIPFEPIDWDQEDPEVLFVPEEFSDNKEELVECIRSAPAHCRTIDVPGGTLYAFSGNIIKETALSDLKSDVAVIYNKFSAKLAEALSPNSTMRPAKMLVQRAIDPNTSPDERAEILDTLERHHGLTPRVRYEILRKAGEVQEPWESVDKIVKCMESQYNPPETALQRSGSNCQFPDAIQDIRKKKLKKKEASTTDEKIDEALEGIATPNDIQPQQGLKALFSAMKQSGLGQELKRVGVSWHIAKPGKHMVTFNKGEVPILQKTSVELADEKELSETLAQLTSIAQGKAPQAAELELDRVKEIAKRAGDRRKALDSIAQKYAVPDPETAAAQQLAQQQAVQPAAQPARPAVRQ